MGLFNKKDRAEKKAYRKIVKQKTTIAARQAYADEAVKVAGERARAKARRPSLLGLATKRVQEGTRKVVSGQRRTTTVRRVAKRSYTPVKRRVTKRRYAPVKRRTVARRTTAKPTTPTGPMTLDQAIYG